TAGATASIYENTDTVEINKAFAQIQSKLKRANFDVENNPKARIYYGDARIFLLGKEGRYSVIVNSVSRPDYFSAGKIYTLQFYRQVSKALKADGIFCTWVDKNMGEHGIVTVINTLSKVFKYCAAHRLRTGYYFLICAQRPLRPKYFHDVPASNALREELEKNLPFINLDDFFLYTQISADILKNRPFHDSRLLNTDDFPILEFFVLAAREGPLGRVPDLFLRFQRDLNVDFWMDFVEQKPLTLRQKADKCVALGVLMGNWREYCQEYCDAFLESNPRLKSTYLTLAEKKLEQHKDYYNARNIIAKSAYLNMLKGDRAKAEEYFKLLLDFDPLSIEAHRGLAAIYQGGELENKGLYLKHKIYYDFLMRSPR
ncbi:MAG: hypothetical protein JW869_07130, partial [Candidatus Omnitrophica bacterium]|nr:hypothetical protein [Candidatus Omnitrophota bacterium]